MTSYVDFHPYIYGPHLLSTLTLSYFKTVFNKTYIYESPKNNLVVTDVHSTVWLFHESRY